MEADKSEETAHWERSLVNSAMVAVFVKANPLEPAPLRRVQGEPVMMHVMMRIQDKIWSRHKAFL
jgi:hypothetical protein